MGLTYRQQLDDAEAQLCRAIPGLQITSSGGACPFQMDGLTPDGEEFYFRYRHDEAALYVYPAGKDLQDAHLYAELREATKAGWDRSELGPQEVVTLFQQLWKMLSPREQWPSTGVERLRAKVEVMVVAMRAKS